MKEADREVATIAAGQYGVFSRRQAAKAGLKDEAMTRRVISGRWERRLPGVYCLAGVPPTPHQDAIAAVLWAGPESAISHTSGAWLLQLTSERSGPWHVTRTANSTKLDCAGILGDEPLEAAFEQARRLGLTSPTALARRAEQLCGKGRPGSARVRRLLAAQAPGERALESRLEVRLARLLRTSGLPAPERQYRLGGYRLDFAWSTVLIACECDGFEHHGARLAWKRDRTRLAAIEAAGWRVVHVTWDDVTRRPEQTLERLAVAFRKAA